MFTGIVEEIGKVKRVKIVNNNYQVKISAQKVLTDVQLGDSIAVNGVCLTVTHFSNSEFTVDLAPETRSRTNLEQLKAGAMVNLERALLPTSRMGGHFVQGHVEGTATLILIKKDKNVLWLTFKAEQSLMRYIVDKGFVCLDGTSLTIAEVKQETFSITLVPFTQEHTILAQSHPEDKINVEVDILGKYVEKFVNTQKVQSNITEQFLAQNGFF